MSKKLSLNNQIYKIISEVSDSTAAGMITVLIVQKFEELQEFMRSAEMGSYNWTEEHDELMNDWIKSNT